MEYHQLPDRVQEIAADPDLWRDGDPTDIHTRECVSCGETLYWVDVPDETDERCAICGEAHAPRDAYGCPVNEWGELDHAEYIGEAYMKIAGGGHGVLCLGCYENMDYHPDGTVTVVEPVGHTHKSTFMNGVCYDPREMPPYGDRETPEWVIDVIEAAAGGMAWNRVDGWRGSHHGPQQTGGLSKVTGGWHSTVDQSELSDRINAITSGEAHTRGGWDWPVAVVFGTTSNVFSTTLSVYAPPEYHDIVSDYLDARAAPAYAGVSTAD